ncbi:MAG: M1 family metallopeptidase [Acidobacteriota bacterium]
MWELALLMAIAPGIPKDLAEQRARQIGNLRYELELDVPAARTQPIQGRARISYDLQDSTLPVVLDFAPGARNLLRASSEYREENGHLIFAPGTNRIELDFRLGDAPLNRNDEFFYSLFVPARAHHAIPCFDQPDLKARLKVTLRAPQGWQILTNASPGQETKPLPSYLWFFAAGKFSVETDGKMRLFHRETDRAKVERNKAEIFRLHAQALDWMERYTGIPYPFEKLDFMALPSFQFGGMEHAGAISYKSPSLFLEQSATQAQQLGRASVIAHETAHMWFGDLVTMRWFSDVWLKEVFANFMAAKIVNPSFPTLNHDLRFYLNHYRSAYNVDRTRGTNPIRQPLDNLNEAGSLYGPIIYQKSPIVMKQLEQMLGEEPFRDGLRRYLTRFSYGNATWDELIGIFGPDLSQWSRLWIDTPGRPKVTKVQRYDGFTLPGGYGEYHLDAPSRAYLLANLPRITDPLVRAQAWDALWEDRAGLFELALRAIPVEKEELLLQRMLTDLGRLMWRHPRDLDRVEAMLSAALSRAPNRGVKAAFWQLYRSVAPPARLERLFSGQENIPDLPFAETDFIAIAHELGLRGIDVRPAMRQRITNPDRREQFDFVSGALDGDGGAWFARLRDPQARAREPWVLEGLALLFHPRRAAANEKFLAPALELLPEVQRTGDIFFPQRWAQVILESYRTLTAAALVRQVLPSYNERLQRTLLVAADDLLWAVSNARQRRP